MDSRNNDYTTDSIGYLITYFSKRLINYDTIERIPFVISRNWKVYTNCNNQSEQLTVDSAERLCERLLFYRGKRCRRVMEGGGHASFQTPL